MFGKELPDFTAKSLEVINQDAGFLFRDMGFYLAGGTALTLHIKHRVSYDLDWFAKQKFNPLALSKQLEASGVMLENIETSEATLHGVHQDCKISFFYYDYPNISEPTIFPNFNFKIASLIDIALMKVTAIADRGTKKDFIDLYFLANELGGLEYILANFEKKFPQANLYHYMKSLTFFEDADQMPDLTMLREAEWKDVKGYFQNEVKKIPLS